MCDRTPLEKQRDMENNTMLKLIAERLGRVIELLAPADRRERGDGEDG